MEIAGRHVLVAGAGVTGKSVVPHVLALPNVVALHSLSKIHGLAALRLGFAVGHPTILDRLRRVTGKEGRR